MHILHTHNMYVYMHITYIYVCVCVYVYVYILNLSLLHCRFFTAEPAGKSHMHVWLVIYT